MGWGRYKPLWSDRKPGLCSSEVPAAVLDDGKKLKKTRLSQEAGGTKQSGSHQVLSRGQKGSSDQLLQDHMGL